MKQTNTPTNKQTNKQPDKQTNKQTNKQNPIQKLLFCQISGCKALFRNQYETKLGRGALVLKMQYHLHKNSFKKHPEHPFSQWRKWTLETDFPYSKWVVLPSVIFCATPITFTFKQIINLHTLQFQI